MTLPKATSCSSGWRPFTYNGRPFVVDSEFLNCLELTSTGWVYNTVPTCEIEREGIPISAQNGTKPRTLATPPGWRPFECNGRWYLVDPEGVNCIERTLDGWVINTIPACIVQREGARADCLPGSDWRAWDYAGRPFLVDPGEFEALERIADGWVRSVPACVVCREGQPIDQTM